MLETANPRLGVSRSTAYILSFIGFVLVLLPKINVVSVENQSAGLRIDDFVISLVFFLFIAASYRYRLLPEIEKSGRFYLFFCFFSLLATSFNIYTKDVGSLLYPIRLVEYFIFFIIGYHCRQQDSVSAFLLSFLTINFVLSILQSLGLVGGFSSEGFNAEASDRPYGTTGGPWELAGIANLIFAYFAFEERGTNKWRNLIFVFAATTFLILLTKSRIALVAQLVAILIFLRHRGTSFSAFAFSGIFFVVCFYIIFALDLLSGVSERSEGLFSVNNFYAFQDMYDGLGNVGTAIEFPRIEQVSDTDASWLFRVAKWSFAVKYWCSNLLSIFFGVGAGAWGIALDGGILRLVTENGLIGFALFFLFAYASAKQSVGSFVFIVMLVVNMLMIDIYIAYKFMATLLILIGHSARQKSLP